MYRVYQPGNVHEEDRSIHSTLKEYDFDSPLRLSYFPALSQAIYLGFKNLTYISHHLPDGRIFWITAEHAKAIGKTLVRNMDFLGLELSCFQPGAAKMIASAISTNVSINEICIAHKTADEVTKEEAAAIGDLLVRCSTRVVHIWAGDFENHALDLLVKSLKSGGSTALVMADICNVSIAEPQDRIRHAPLESLLEKNRRSAGPFTSLLGTSP